MQPQSPIVSKRAHSPHSLHTLNLVPKVATQFVFPSGHIARIPSTKQFWKLQELMTAQVSKRAHSPHSLHGHRGGVLSAE